MTEQEKIEHWWKKQCSKCAFRSTLSSGSHAGGTCGYIILTGKMRGCDMENCKRFSPGKKIGVRVDIDFGPKKRKKEGVPKRKEGSKCACGLWLDARLGETMLKDFAAAIGFNAEYVCKFRKRTGAIMSDAMAERTAEYFGVTVGEIRAAEERYAETAMRKAT